MRNLFLFGVKTNKKGNVSVMLSMIFVSLMLVVVVLVNASSLVATYSYCDCVVQLAGRSVLSEYHLALKENYGIFAFNSYPQEINERLRFYINSSFNRKRANNELTLIKPKLDHIKCNINLYSLVDVDNLENEIVDYMKYPKIESKNKEVRPYEGEGKLVNQKIINSLPSRGLKNSGFNIGSIVSNGLPSWSEIMTKNTRVFVVNQYLLKHFNNRFEINSSTETFFNNELEYILYGKLADKANQDKFISDFKKMRVILNSAFIYADFEKRNQVLEMAEIMTPGPEAAITAIALAEAWAYAESLNDVKLLLAGEKVPIYKKKLNWAIDLNSAIKGRNDKGYIKPDTNKGLKYKDYLQIFLYFEDRETKLLRTMDLIQINIQGGFDGSFYIRDCYIGFSYKANISGQEYSYVQKY